MAVNLWRGLAGSNQGMDRATADYMGMLGNSDELLSIARCIRTSWRRYSRTNCYRNAEIAEPYIRRRAIRH